MMANDTESQTCVKKLRNEDLEHIKEWLRKQPHLPDTWDELCLINFLKCCNYSLERCKKKLDMYFTMRAMVPEVFTNRDITRPEFQKVLKLGNVSVLPNLTPENRVVAIARALYYDFDTPDVMDIATMICMMADNFLATETREITGEIFIFEGNVNLTKHFYRLPWPLIRKLLIACQKAYPIRIKEIHVINNNPFVNFIINTLKPFVKGKILDRIHIHSTFESVQEFIPKEILPEEYGGNAGKLADLQRDFLKKIEDHTEWLQKQRNVKADEKKRAGKACTFEEVFGIDGSFRQLNID